MRVDNDDDSNEEPLYQQRCGTCGNAFGYEDHFQPSPNYHEFDAGKSAAPPARERLSTNGGAGEDEQVSAASGD